MTLSAQQAYHRAMAERLPGSLNSLNWQFSGFHNRIVELLTAGLHSSELTDEKECLHFLPDAHIVDVKEREILLLEIVDSSDLTDVKVRQLTDFFWLMDDIDWKLIVICFYPRHSNTLLVEDWHLMDHYADRCEGKTERYLAALHWLEKTAVDLSRMPARRA